MCDVQGYTCESKRDGRKIHALEQDEECPGNSRYKLPFKVLLLFLYSCLGKGMASRKGLIASTPKPQK